MTELFQSKYAQVIRNYTRTEKVETTEGGETTQAHETGEGVFRYRYTLISRPDSLSPKILQTRVASEFIHGRGSVPVFGLLFDDDTIAYSGKGASGDLLAQAEPEKTPTAGFVADWRGTSFLTKDNRVTNRKTRLPVIQEVTVYGRSSSEVMKLAEFVVPSVFDPSARIQLGLVPDETDLFTVHVDMQELWSGSVEEFKMLPRNVT